MKLSFHQKYTTKRINKSASNLDILETTSEQSDEFCFKVFEIQGQIDEFKPEILKICHNFYNAANFSHYKNVHVTV